LQLRSSPPVVVVESVLQKLERVLHYHVPMTTTTTSTSLPRFTIIVAATSSRLGIGFKGILPWRLKREIGYFKHATTFHPDALTNVVIMGRKCWESIPPKFRPLPKRHNIVLSRRGRVDGIHETSLASEVATSLVMALERSQNRGFGRIFVIGGGEVYREAMDIGCCERILFTEVMGEVETDVEFPVEFRKEGWKRASHEQLEKFIGNEVEKGDITEGNLQYSFQMWEREITLE
jgi:dihydrofolate reductase